MSEMVERVARAICRAEHIQIHGEYIWRPGELDNKVDAYWPKAINSAHAAIKALHIPTESMFAIANRLEADYKSQLKSFEVTGFCAHIYQAMIDVALEPDKYGDVSRSAGEASKE